MFQYSIFFHKINPLFLQSILYYFRAPSEACKVTERQQNLLLQHWLHEQWLVCNMWCNYWRNFWVILSDIFKVDAKEGEKGYCNGHHNPTELVEPTASEVLEFITLIDLKAFAFYFQNWGFCHISCYKDSYHASELQKTVLTTLSDDLCSKTGRMTYQGDPDTEVNIKVSRF